MAINVMTIARCAGVAGIGIALAYVGYKAVTHIRNKRALAAAVAETNKQQQREVADDVVRSMISGVVKRTAEKLDVEVTELPVDEAPDAPITEAVTADATGIDPTDEPQPAPVVDTTLAAAALAETLARGECLRILEEALGESAADAIAGASLTDLRGAVWLLRRAELQGEHKSQQALPAELQERMMNALTGMYGLQDLPPF